MFLGIRQRFWRRLWRFKRRLEFVVVLVFDCLLFIVYCLLISKY